MPKVTFNFSHVATIQQGRLHKWVSVKKLNEVPSRAHSPTFTRVYSLKYLKKQRLNTPVIYFFATLCIGPIEFKCL